MTKKTTSPKHVIDLGESADMFCGAGGASTGLLDAVNQRAAETRQPHRISLLAINHWDIAIATHKLNHPTIRHIQDDLERINAREAVPSGRLRFLVTAPECIHFSNARGGEPMNWQSRATVKYVIRWDSVLEIDDILLENVREFRTWGPLHRDHSHGCPAKPFEPCPVNSKQKRIFPKCHYSRPIESRKGQFFLAFIRKLESRGYTVEHRLLCAADYGDPTSRVRFFLRARKTGSRIAWPQPTHAAKPHNMTGKFKPYRTAREIIQWDDLGESIFAKTHGPFRNRYLVANTMRRIFVGMQKFGGLSFVLPNEGFYRNNQPQSPDKPLGTITSRGAGYVVNPFLVEYHNGDKQDNRAKSVDQPLPTQDTSNRFGLAQPFLLGIRGGQDGYTRGASVDNPAPTITTAPAMALINPHLVKFYGTANAASVDEPLDTITGRDSFGVATPFLFSMEHSSEASGHDRRVFPADQSFPTLTARAAFGVVVPFMVGNGGLEGQGRPRSVDKPFPAITGTPRLGIAGSFVIGQQSCAAPRSVDDPLPTIAGAGAISLINPFAYVVNHGAAGYQDMNAPLKTITSADAWNLANPVIVPVNHGKSDSRAHSVQQPFPSLTSVDAWSLAQAHAVSPLSEIECPLPNELPDEFGPFKPFLFRHQGTFVLLVLTSQGIAMLDVRFRMIKPRELARAHSLDNYTFVGSREQVVKQIGNSVPKKLAQALCYSALFS